jgi:hypothetical protein
VKTLCRAFLLLAVLLTSGPASARVADCQTSINGEVLSLAYDTDDKMLRENRTYRERIFGKAGRVTCPGYVTLRALTPDLSDTERALFCLQYDRSQRTYTGLVVGPRDAFVGCKAPSRTFCDRVTATRDQIGDLTAIGGRLASGVKTAVGAAGVTAIEHSSGALILTGSSGYMSGTLGSLASGALATLTAPATSTAALVTVVAVGGSVYYCSE